MMAEDPEAKAAASKNGKKSNGAQRSSFFTWFLVLAMLGVWTSVAVVWLGLVDSPDITKNLAAYDVDGDGDFDLQDAKVLLGLDNIGDNLTTLDLLLEEGSDWLYGFLGFLYDIMTPFEIQEDIESESAAEADEGLGTEVASKKEKPREHPLIRDIEWNLRESLKRQMSILHERVEAKKIAKMALAEVRALMAKEAEARQALKAQQQKKEAAAIKGKEKRKEKPSKSEKKRTEREEKRKPDRGKKEKKQRVEKPSKTEKKKEKIGKKIDKPLFIEAKKKQKADKDDKRPSKPQAKKETKESTKSVAKKDASRASHKKSSKQSE